MKKEMASLMIFSMLFGLAGCNGSDAGSDNPVAARLGKDVTTISIEHFVMGNLVQWTAENEELDQLKDWASALECRLLKFEEGQSPGDSDGGEGYIFSLAEGDYPGFSYVINGPDQCYLLTDGNWYSVANPSTPPVTEPHGVKSALEKPEELSSSPLDGVAMTVTEASAAGVTVRITNDTDKEIQCGADFRLMMLEEETGSWREPDTVIDNAAFKAMAYLIPKDSPLEMEVTFEWLYGKLKAGRYRIVKTITDFRGTGDYTDYTFSADFMIEE